MTAHTVNLPAALDRFVRDQVASGDHADSESVILAGLERLKAEAIEDEKKMERFMAEVQIGIDQFERGEFIEITDLDAYGRDVMARVEAKIAAEEARTGKAGNRAA